MGVWRYAALAKVTRLAPTTQARRISPLHPGRDERRRASHDLHDVRGSPTGGLLHPRGALLTLHAAKIRRSRYTASVATAAVWTEGPTSQLSVLTGANRSQIFSPTARPAPYTAVYAAARLTDDSSTTSSSAISSL